MRHSFTAAAERALAEAALWALGEISDTLEAPALLLGLLAESECRAALVLARHAIGPDSVRARWPSLIRTPNRFAAWGSATSAHPHTEVGVPVRHFASEVQLALAAVARRLRKWGLHPELGTEHILFGLTVAGHEVSEWLSQHGVCPAGLEEDILRAHGYQRSESALSSPPLSVGDVEDQLADGGDEPSQRLPAEAPAESTPASQVAPPEGGAAPERLAILRVIDATANRAREGLRVVEDYVRFVLDDRYLTDLLKSLRHDLTGLLAQFPAGERLAARETLADVGTQLATPDERRREDTASVAAANFARLQESLRSLEEFTKILNPAASAALEQIRYRTYTLQRAAETTRSGVERLDRARLYALVDGGSAFDDFCQRVRLLVSAGVHVIQLRDKHLDDRTLIERARALRDITAQSNVVFIMNDRPDLAILSRADGVHVGQEELEVKDARAIVGPQAIVGVSTHSIEQARQAVLDGANYIGVGPVFPSETKHFERFPGLELLRDVAAEIRLPAFAIGGITLDRLPSVLQTGACRVAVGAAISAAPSPTACVRAFLDALR